MKQTINDRLIELRQMAEVIGPNPEESSQFVKAYRAAQFGRCPNCDERGLVVYDAADLSKHIECRNCGKVVVMDMIAIRDAIDQHSDLTMDAAFQLAVVDKFCS